MHTTIVIGMLEYTSQSYEYQSCRTLPGLSDWQRSRRKPFAQTGTAPPEHPYLDDGMAGQLQVAGILPTI